MNNLFFKYLNWILKTDKNKPEIPRNSLFMTNRWLSMTSKPIAQIVNSTTNKWNIDDESITSKILHCIIPKNNKKINYIKKSSQEDEENIDNLENICNSMNLSKREIKMYEKTLEDLGLINK